MGVSERIESGEEWRGTGLSLEGPSMRTCGLLVGRFRIRNYWLAYAFVIDDFDDGGELAGVRTFLEQDDSADFDQSRY